MERRDEGRERGMPNSMSYNPTRQVSSSESPPVKLPLVPIISIPPDRRGNNATVSARRRGSSIFSPTRTLDDPPPGQQQQPHKEPNPDPDLSQTPTGPTNFRNPHQQQQQQEDNDNSSTTTTTTTTTTTSAAIRYRECLKNHAASMGGHVVDGCGEFMPSGDDGTPESLHCSVCDCHRNFHRKEVDVQTPRNQHAHSNSMGPTMVNFGGGVDSSSEDLNIFQSSRGGHAVMQPSYNYNYNTSSGGSKKRRRTKFSQDQKDKMQDLAERLGWRMQKQNEGEVEQFCIQTGVNRQVFKVWMHNSKQAMKKKQT